MAGSCRCLGAELAPDIVGVAAPPPWLSIRASSHVGKELRFNFFGFRTEHHGYGIPFGHGSVAWIPLLGSLRPWLCNQANVLFVLDKSRITCGHCSRRMFLFLVPVFNDTKLFIYLIVFVKDLVGKFSCKLLLVSSCPGRFQNSQATQVFYIRFFGFL